MGLEEAETNEMKIIKHYLSVYTVNKKLSSVVNRASLIFDEARIVSLVVMTDGLDC